MEFIEALGVETLVVSYHLFFWKCSGTLERNEEEKQKHQRKIRLHLRGNVTCCVRLAKDSLE